MTHSRLQQLGGRAFIAVGALATGLQFRASIEARLPHIDGVFAWTALGTLLGGLYFGFGCLAIWQVHDWPPSIRALLRRAIVPAGSFFISMFPGATVLHWELLVIAVLCFSDPFNIARDSPFNDRAPARPMTPELPVGLALLLFLLPPVLFFLAWLSK